VPATPPPGSPARHRDREVAQQELGQKTWTELEDRPRGTALVVPLGSLEQHGPHLPLDTDTRIAVALAQRVAAERPWMLVAPPLCFGASGEHAGFPGTLSMDHAVLAGVLVELVRSARSTFEGVVFVSGHGGNAEALRRTGERAEQEGDRVLTWTPVVAGSDAHAGHTETSMLLALDPASVRRDRLVVGRTEPLAELWPALRRGGVRQVSANGVLGDPREASAGAGEIILATMTGELGRAVDRWWVGVAEPAGAASGSHR